MIYTLLGSEVTPFPGGAIEIDEQTIVSSTGSLFVSVVSENVIIIKHPFNIFAHASFS